MRCILLRCGICWTWYRPVLRSHCPHCCAEPIMVGKHRRYFHIIGNRAVEVVRGIKNPLSPQVSASLVTRMHRDISLQSRRTKRHITPHLYAGSQTAKKAGDFVISHRPIFLPVLVVSIRRRSIAAFSLPQPLGCYHLNRYVFCRV